MESPPVFASTLCMLFCLSSGKGKEPRVPHQFPFLPRGAFDPAGSLFLMGRTLPMDRTKLGLVA